MTVIWEGEAGGRGRAQTDPAGLRTAARRAAGHGAVRANPLTATERRPVMGCASPLVAATTEHRLRTGRTTTPDREAGPKVPIVAGLTGWTDGPASPLFARRAEGICRNREP